MTKNFFGKLITPTNYWASFPIGQTNDGNNSIVGSNCFDPIEHVFRLEYSANY